MRLVGCWCVVGFLGGTDVVGAIQSGQDFSELDLMAPEELSYGFFRDTGLKCIADYGFDAGLEVREGWA